MARGDRPCAPRSEPILSSTRYAVRVYVGLLLLALCGCAPALQGLRDAGLPAAGAVPGVPAFAQTEHHCGPAALASILAWAGKPETPEALSALAYTPGRKGTLPIDLAREIRARGLLAYRVLAGIPSLLREVTAGHPVLILENRGLSWYPLWHYSVLTGYDLAKEEATLLAGGAEPERVPISTLSHTWARGGSFGLVALPPGTLPAAGDPQGILAAVADLEETGQRKAAAEGYEAFLQRWPGEWRAAFGWGNTLHGLGRDDLAEEAFRRAHGTAPERPEPLNNLALLALAMGRREEAVALAQLALESARKLGLPAGPYEDTLREASEGR